MSNHNGFTDEYLEQNVRDEAALERRQRKYHEEIEDELDDAKSRNGFMLGE